MDPARPGPSRAARLTRVAVAAGVAAVVFAAAGALLLGMMAEFSGQDPLVPRLNGAGFGALIGGGLVAFAALVMLVAQALLAAAGAAFRARRRPSTRHGRAVR